MLRIVPVCFSVTVLLLMILPPLRAAEPSRPIELSVDASEAPRKLLHAQVIIPAKRRTVRLPTDQEQLVQIAGVGIADKQLPGIGPTFLDDRGCLAPDQLGAAGAEAPVTPQRQLVRFAVLGPIAAFHRLETERIPGTQRSHLDRPKERAQVGAEAQIETETATLRLQVVEGVEFEITCHNRPPGMKAASITDPNANPPPVFVAAFASAGKPPPHSGECGYEFRQRARSDWGPVLLFS